MATPNNKASRQLVRGQQPGANITAQLLPLRQRLHAAYDAVGEAAESGDMELAGQLFRQAMQLQEKVRQATELAIDQASQPTAYGRIKASGK